MKRILHFVYALTQSSGLTNSIMNFYRHIDTDLVQFDFVYYTDADSEIVNEIEHKGGRVYHFHVPGLSLKFVKERNTFFKQHQGEYDAIHGSALFAVAFYGKVAKKNGIQHIIAHAHSTVYGDNILSRLRNFFIIRKTRKVATNFIACSIESGLFLFGKNGIPNNDFLVIHNAIECEQYRFSMKKRELIRSELRLQDGEFALCHVGGFKAVKNHAFIVDVFSSYVKIFPNAKLFLVGGEVGSIQPITKKIKKLVHDLNIDNNVFFVGTRKDINLFLCGMDGFLFPSLYEGLPTSLIEAQASGLDCIVSDVITKEVDIGLCHFNSLNQDKAIWCDAISNYCNNKRNRSYCCDKAEESGFDIFNEAKKLQEFYLSLL